MSRSLLHWFGAPTEERIAGPQRFSCQERTCPLLAYTAKYAAAPRVLFLQFLLFMAKMPNPTQAIVDDVESGGTKSLIAQALRLGDIKSESDPLLLGPVEMKAAYDQLAEKDQQVLLRTKVSAVAFLLRRCCVIGLCIFSSVLLVVAVLSQLLRSFLSLYSSIYALSDGVHMRSCCVCPERFIPVSHVPNKPALFCATTQAPPRKQCTKVALFLSNSQRACTGGLFS